MIVFLINKMSQSDTGDISITDRLTYTVNYAVDMYRYGKFLCFMIAAFSLIALIIVSLSCISFGGKIITIFLTSSIIFLAGYYIVYLHILYKSILKNRKILGI